MGHVRNDFPPGSRDATGDGRPAGIRGAAAGWSAYLPAILLFIVGMAGLTAVAAMDAKGGGRYLVIAGPGARMADMVDILRAADGRLVQASRFPNIAVAWSDRPDFAAATRRSGAWLAIAAPDGGGCYGASDQETQL